MKIFLLINLLIFSRTMYAQNNVPVSDTLFHAVVTAAGKPNGEIAAMKIGREGGSFTSSDGLVRLIFPEGALSKKTTIRIQPVTNMAPNGNGKAYQMEPAGIVFQKPVQIVFYNIPEVTAGVSPGLMGIGMQDEKGSWFGLNNAVTDTVFHTLHASINHFSTYINYLKAKIDPSSARVKVNGTVRLRITLVSTVSEEEEELAPLGVAVREAPAWSVNGIPDGNSLSGIVSVSQHYTSIYQAPAQIPEQNPVTVSVHFRGSSTSIREKKYNDLRLVSNITIYDDAYEIKMEASMTGGSPLAWGGIVTYRDEGSFIVSLNKNKPALINIKNNMEVMTDNCEKVILNPNSNTGIFHVLGASQIRVTPANPPTQPYPVVEIAFLPYPTELTRFRFICPPPPGALPGASIGKVDLSQMTMMMFMGRPSLPQYLKFIANDQDQVILESPPGVREIYYRIWVHKVTESE